jgi:pimeloyl-ACP methyl ester carboxylesterase
MSPASEPRHYQRGPLRTIWPSPAGPSRRRSAAKADPDYGVPAAPSWRDLDWPSLTHQAQIAGRPVNYVTLGEGDETVVFVHGLGGSWQNWLENLPAIAASGRRAVALDLPGFGRSAMPQEPISITLFASTVDALCDELGLGPVHVVGNSMGGFTAAETAIRHPARVTTLTLVDAAGISSREVAKNPVAQHFAVTVLGGNGAATATDADGKPRALTMMRRPAGVHALMAMVARHPTRLARDLIGEQLHSIGSAGFMPALDAIFHYDFVERLTEIGCPTLIVQGEKDLLVPLGDAYEFERLIPKSTVLTFADTGHVPMMERPAAFNAALLEFVGADATPHQPDVQASPILADGRA